MASKADRLKGGANRASTGLFAGMTPLNKGAEKNETKSKIEKVKKVEEVSEIPEKEQEITPSEPEKAVESNKNIEKVVQPVIEEEKANTEASETNIVQEEVHIDRDEVPVMAEQLGEKIAMVNNAAEAKAQQIMPEYQTIPEAIPVQQYIPEPSVQPYVQNMQMQNVQTPQYQQQVYQQIQPQSIPVQQYQMPNNYQQPVMQQPVMPVYNEPKQAKASKQDKSRYEKEKFLLLDIRGYRDYVEHMAKASNMSATKYIRSLIEQDMMRNMDIYQQHKQLEEALKARR